RLSDAALRDAGGPRAPVRPGPPARGQRGERRADLLHPVARRGERDQVGLGEVAVVLRLLLAPSRGGDPGVLVEMAGLPGHSLPPLPGPRPALHLLPPPPPHPPQPASLPPLPP